MKEKNFHLPHWLYAVFDMKNTLNCLPSITKSFMFTACSPPQTFKSSRHYSKWSSLNGQAVIRNSVSLSTVLSGWLFVSLKHCIDYITVHTPS